jgi:hypothetical protein
MAVQLASTLGLHIDIDGNHLNEEGSQKDKDVMLYARRFVFWTVCTSHT